MLAHVIACMLPCMRICMHGLSARLCVFDLLRLGAYASLSQCFRALECSSVRASVRQQRVRVSIYLKYPCAREPLYPSTRAPLRLCS
eukprot:6193376-Pleurochrysis_carterae.AAC.1